MPALSASAKQQMQRRLSGQGRARWRHTSAHVPADELMVLTDSLPAQKVKRERED